MFRFANPENLYWLLALPPLIIGAWLCFRGRRRALRRFVDAAMIPRLVPGLDRRRSLIKTALLLIALSLLIVAMGRPQFGTRVETVEREGQDVVVALDVSNSMLAQDIQPSRLAKAKRSISSLIDLLEGDRVGLVAFAGAAFVQCPLTLDYGAAKMFLDALDPDVVPVQGTALEEAIRKAIEMYPEGDAKHRVLILITDGEAHEGNPVEAARRAAQAGIVVYAIGIGSTRGTPIPIEDEQGRPQGFLKDSEGNIVTTRLDQGTLEAIARETGGKYFRASPGERELSDIQAEIAGMDKKHLAAQEFTQFDEQFQVFLGVAWALLVLELLLGEGRKAGRTWRGRFQ